MGKVLTRAGRSIMPTMIRRYFHGDEIAQPSIGHHVLDWQRNHGHRAAYRLGDQPKAGRSVQAAGSLPPNHERNQHGARWYGHKRFSKGKRCPHRS